MPFRNRRKDVKEKNGTKKAKSSLAVSFRKYNKDGITTEGLKNFFIYNFYKIGYTIEYITKELSKVLGKAADRLLDGIREFLKDLVRFSGRLFGTIVEDLSEPFALAGSMFSTIGSIIGDVKQDENRKASKEVKKFLTEGAEKHRDSIKSLIGYMVPVLCAVVFFTVAHKGLSRELALRVFVNGKDLGLVNNYTVLDNATSIIENQLVATNNQEWSLDTQVKIVNLKSETTIDERALANNILNSSDRDVRQATGLYIDGKFIGAVENGIPLREALDSLKAPYENGEDNRTISFVQDVQLVDGIFFMDSIVPDRDLSELVVGEVSGELRYTVVSGDSPSKIASKNGITLKQLYSMNPGLEGGGLWVGDSLVVSASVPYLQVKYTERITREVEVPFKTKTEKNSSMTYGKVSVSQKGEKGINEELVDVTYIDGVYQNENIIQTTVIKEPVDQINQQGTNLNGLIIENVGTGRLMWPVPGYSYVSRGFTGQYKAGGHDGLDICGAYGTPIYAADSGVVTKAAYTYVGYGVHVIIEHGGYQTLYGHCSSLAVSTGQQVVKGQLIAYMGSTGNSTGNHCHFEVKNGNTRMNPMSWF